MRKVKILVVSISVLFGLCVSSGSILKCAQAAITESVAKNAALQMTSTLENSTTELQFNYAENIGDGRGITFGAIGFCTGTYDGNELVKHYTELNPNNNLAKYIPALDAIDAGPHNSAGGDGNPSTTGLSGFIAAVESNTDPLFRQAQLDMLDELYWDPAVDMTNTIGAKNNLTLAFIYDMSIRQGPDGAQDIINSAKSSLGGTPATGVNETTFLNKLFSLRDKELSNEGLGDVDRDDGFKQVLSSGNVNLNTPYSFTAYGDSFTIKAGVYTDTGSTSTEYALIVNYGTGDGSYASGTKVTITADTPASGKVFDKWTGATSYLASTTAATTTVTIPSQAISLTATYKDAPVTTYNLIVNYGTGDGSYASGTKVTITADTPASGKVFDKWTGATSYLASTTAATTTVTMPSQAISLTATYKDAPVTTYNLTVNSGSGSGSYAVGAKITITANTTTGVKTFDKWTGDTTYLASTTSTTTTVTMPNGDINVTATYKDITYALTVGSGTGEGMYRQGDIVTIQAGASPAGYTFSKWTGDTAYLASTTSAITTVTMPNKAISVTATYTNGSSTTTEKAYYLLVVNQGSGSEAYESGTRVKIEANPAISELIFDGWTGDVQYLDDAKAFTTYVTMPANHISVTATYKNSSTLYTLTINHGTGGGSYVSGGAVTITADAASQGQVFDKWIGDISYLASATSATTTLNMPNKSIILTATYKTADSSTSLPDGTLVKLANSFQVYVIIDGEKKWVPTPQVFSQLGYQWTEIKVLSETELNAIPDYEDNLIRAVGDYRVYLVVNGFRRHIPSPEVFLSYGFAWSDIKVVSQEIMNKYQDTCFIQEDGTSTIYYLREDGLRKLIPTTAILDSYNNEQSDIQIISNYEMARYPLSNLVRLSGSYDIYLVEGNIKRKISSPLVFSRLRLNWNQVININQMEFNFYQDGEVVR